MYIAFQKKYISVAYFCLAASYLANKCVKKAIKTINLMCQLYDNLVQMLIYRLQDIGF